MASNVTSDPVQLHNNKSKKNKKKKAKSTATKDATNGTATEHEGPDDGADDDDTSQSPTAADPASVEHAPSTIAKPPDDPDTEQSYVAPVDTVDTSQDEAKKESYGTDERLESAAKERDQLRAEVTELRQSLEELQQRHDTEIEEAKVAKEHAETRYQKLLGQVNTIKTQLGERLKNDAAELAQVRSQVEELETENKGLQERNQTLQSEISKANDEQDRQSRQNEELRGRTNTSQQQWAKERDELVTKEAQVREEFEAAKQAMQDWEVLAMEERSVREGLGDRVSELEEQIANQRESYDRAISERDQQSVTVDGLQRALQEIQEARKVELREVVENTQTQLEDLRKQLKAAEESSTSSQASLETAQRELERTIPFEKEVKEKNLLIGKLRHEAVILNDHLTKALRYLKKGKPEDNVDRQLITNHILHFLQLDRSDPKKFQVLQLIAAILGWTEEQKESSGLSRPGASSSTGSLKVPLGSSFRRVSSSTSVNSSMTLNNALTSPTSPTGSLGNAATKESIAELWSDFLEREAQEGMNKDQRKGSISGSTGPGTPIMSGMKSPSEIGTPRLSRMDSLNEKSEERPVSQSGPGGDS